MRFDLKLILPVLVMAEWVVEGKNVAKTNLRRAKRKLDAEAGVDTTIDPLKEPEAYCAQYDGMSTSCVSYGGDICEWNEIEKTCDVVAVADNSTRRIQIVGMELLKENEKRKLDAEAGQDPNIDPLEDPQAYCAQYDGMSTSCVSYGGDICEWNEIEKKCGVVATLNNATRALDAEAGVDPTIDPLKEPEAYCAQYDGMSTSCVSYGGDICEWNEIEKKCGVVATLNNATRALDAEAGVDPTIDPLKEPEAYCAQYDGMSTSCVSYGGDICEWNEIEKKCGVVATLNNATRALDAEAGVDTTIDPLKEPDAYCAQYDGMSTSCVSYGGDICEWNEIEKTCDVVAVADNSTRRVQIVGMELLKENEKRKLDAEAGQDPNIDPLEEPDAYCAQYDGMSTSCVSYGGDICVWNEIEKTCDVVATLNNATRALKYSN